MKIERAPEVEPRLRTALRKAGQREIGGLLMAEQLSPAHFRILDFSLDAFSGAHTRFRRDPRTHQRALDEFFERTGRDFQRFNYLGEWHSHPSFSVLPSVEDIQTMTDIVESRNSAITFAVLLIVRLRWQLWIDCSLTVFARGQGSRGLSPSRRLFPGIWTPLVDEGWAGVGRRGSGRTSMTCPAAPTAPPRRPGTPPRA